MNDTDISGCVILAGTPCEIQIRSLLQHAYSELTHDTIYKPSVQASPEAKRFAARSVALLEAADETFVRVAEEIEKAEQPGADAMQSLAASYRSVVKREPEHSRIGSLLVETYFDKIPDNVSSILKNLAERKPFLAERIRERAEDRLLFRQAAVLFIYYLVENAPNETRENWPLTPKELRPFYTDLGETFPIGE